MLNLILSLMEWDLAHARSVFEIDGADDYPDLAHVHSRLSSNFRKLRIALPAVSRLPLAERCQSNLRHDLRDEPNRGVTGLSNGFLDEKSAYIALPIHALFPSDH